MESVFVIPSHAAGLNRLCFGYFLIHPSFLSGVCVCMCFWVKAYPELHPPLTAAEGPGVFFFFTSHLKHEFIRTQVLLDLLCVHTPPPPLTRVLELNKSEHTGTCDCVRGVVLKQLAAWGEDAALRLQMEGVAHNSWSWWEDACDVMCILSSTVTPDSVVAMPPKFGVFKRLFWEHFGKYACLPSLLSGHTH